MHVDLEQTTIAHLSIARYELVVAPIVWQTQMQRQTAALRGEQG